MHIRVLVCRLQACKTWVRMGFVIDLHLCLETATSKMEEPVAVLAFVLLKILIQLQKTIVFRSRKHINWRSWRWLVYMPSSSINSLIVLEDGITTTTRLEGAQWTLSYYCLLIQNVTHSNELWVIHFTNVHLGMDLVEVWIKDAERVGWKTTPENWDTLRTRTLQQEHAFEEHKSGSVWIGTCPRLG